MNVRLTTHAVRQLDRLPDDVAEAVQAALNRLAAEDQSLDVRKLVGQAGSYRVRVGDYRIIFTREDDPAAIVSEIAHRREVYRHH